MCYANVKPANFLLKELIYRPTCYKVCYADVKPANFLLKSRFPAPKPSGDADGGRTCRPLPPDVRVIDFGCAQHVVDGAKLAKRTGAALALSPWLP